MFSAEDPTTWAETGELDAELAQLVDEGAVPRYTRNGDDLDAIRAAWAKIAVQDAEQAIESAVSDVEASDMEIPIADSEMRALVYRPTNPPAAGSPLVVMIHGGAFAFGHEEFETMNCVQAVKRYGCVALSVAYTLAPEGKFPVPVYECWEALKWITSNASDLGADPKTGFILGGCSAGGLITAAIVHMAQDEPLAHPLTGICYSVAAFGNQEYLPEEYKHLHTSKGNASTVLYKSGEKPFDVYGAIGSRLRDPEWTIVNWPTGHAGHPPAYFQVCGLDALRDDALIMETELRNKWGKKTKVDMYPGLPHIFWMNYLEHSKTPVYTEDTLRGIGWLLDETARE